MELSLTIAFYAATAADMVPLPIGGPRMLMYSRTLDRQQKQVAAAVQQQAAAQEQQQQQQQDPQQQVLPSCQTCSSPQRGCYLLGIGRTQLHMQQSRAGGFW